MMKHCMLLLLACALLLVQCKPGEQKVSTAEAIKFAEEIEAAALKHRPNLLGSHIILQALVDRMNREKTIKNIGDLEKGMQRGLQNAELDKNIYSMLGKNGTFEKVKVYEKDGAQRVIFRAYGDNGFNYMDMELTKLNEKTGIADMLMYSTGETISKSMADFVNKLSDESNSRQTDEAIENMQSVKRLMAKGNYKQAKRDFDMLPAYVKNTKLSDILGIQIASNLEEEVYLKEIEQFERKYAGEPYLQLLLIDMHFIRKDYDKALAAINQVDSLINKDPFLDYYRGLLYNAKGETDRSIMYHTKVTENLPQFAGAYAELMAHYIEKGDKEKAKFYFTKYKNMRTAKDDIISSYENVYPFLKE